MGASQEIGDYDSRNNGGEGSTKGPFFMEPAGQISLWRERSIIDPAMVELVREVDPRTTAYNYDGQVIL